MTEISTTINPNVNPWEKISDIAKRVGVRPVDKTKDSPSVVALGRDGEWYDVFDIVSSVLDRIESGIREEQ